MVAARFSLSKTNSAEKTDCEETRPSFITARTYATERAQLGPPKDLTDKGHLLEEASDVLHFAHPPRQKTRLLVCRGPNAGDAVWPPVKVE